jgi:CheY-like chemotaxis protein
MTDNKIEQALESFARRELGNVKVLMVEDDVFLSELVLLKLSNLGCVPYSTANGSEALQLAGQYMPDVIILDLMLPGMSGEEILEHLKKDESLKHIPVIVFSNKSEQEDIKKNLAAGAVEYLVKSSTDLNSLADTIRKFALTT